MKLTAFAALAAILLAAAPQALATEAEVEFDRAHLEGLNMDETAPAPVPAQGGTTILTEPAGSEIDNLDVR